jgi:hypothetical protein
VWREEKTVGLIEARAGRAEGENEAERPMEMPREAMVRLRGRDASVAVVDAGGREPVR